MKSMLATRLKECRLASKLTQQQVVDFANTINPGINISRNSISRYENGTRIPSIEILSCLSSIFDVDVDYLIGKMDTKYIINPCIKAFSDSLEKSLSKSDSESISPLSSISELNTVVINAHCENDYIKAFDSIITDISTIFSLTYEYNRLDIITDFSNTLTSKLTSVYQEVLKNDINQIIENFKESGHEGICDLDLLKLKLCYSNCPSTDIPLEVRKIFDDSQIDHKDK